MEVVNTKELEQDNPLINEALNYVELPSADLALTKAFFERVFNWTFTDYGPEYTAFKDKRLDGGFYQAPLQSDTKNGSALLIFYSTDLSGSLHKITEAGGHIVKPIFEFPGGRRFHFKEPSGNEFAVWSDK